jgi:hypothetical protein
MDACIPHIPQVLALSDRTVAQSFAVNGLKEIGFTAGFDAGSN